MATAKDTKDQDKLDQMNRPDADTHTREQIDDPQRRVATSDAPVDAVKDADPKPDTEQPDHLAVEASHEGEVGDMTDAQLQKAYDALGLGQSQIQREIVTYELTTGKRDVRDSVGVAMAHNRRREMEQAVMEAKRAEEIDARVDAELKHREKARV